MSGAGAVMGRADACVLCGAAAGGTAAGTDGLRICPVCDLAWSVLEDPKDPAGEWDRDYYGDPAILELHRGRRSGMEVLADRLSRGAGAPGRLLDVGAGVGVLMKAAADRGWETEGVEPSATAAEWARRLTGAPIHVGFLEQLNLSPGRYDAITVVDTLRHVPDPARFLAEARRLLRPGGLIMIREIHRRTNDAYHRFSVRRVTRRREPRRVAFEYGQRFSPRSLTRGLERAGFEAVRTEPSPVFDDPPPGRRPGPRARLMRLAGFLGILAHRASGGALLILPNFLIFGKARAESQAPRGT